MHINRQSMRKILTLLLLSVLAAAEFCEQPQRKFYMSFPSLSKRDALSNLFRQINQNLSAYENSYTDSLLSANFKIYNGRPQLYYNDHYQADSYLDLYRANVTMGILFATALYNFTITYVGRNVSGFIRVAGSFDPASFTKMLQIAEGYVEWVPENVPALTFSNMFHVEFSSPALSEDELNVLTKLCNGEAGQTRIKQEFTAKVNSAWGPLLRDHLNHQKLIGSNNITYKYGNITLELLNFVKTMELSNGATKGLQVSLLFGLQSSAENCTKLPQDFDQDQYGGLQELYTFATVRAIIKQALAQGLYDVTLDRTWQVPGFQFYMGDLGNFVPYANFLPSADPFAVSCKFNSTRTGKSLLIVMYDVHDLYVGVPLTCVLNYKAADVLAVDMDMNYVVRLYGEQESLRVVVLSSGVHNDVYRSLDPKFQVLSQYLAKHFIAEVLNGMVGKNVFGTGFPLIRRRYPVVQITDYFVIVFDPSEP